VLAEACRVPGTEQKSEPLQQGLAMLAAMRRASSSRERRKKNPKRRNRLGSGGPPIWALSRAAGVSGDGEPPGQPKLYDSTAHAPAEAITPLYSTDYLFVSFTARAERSNSPRSLR
jgi:hypothetical protein